MIIKNFAKNEPFILILLYWIGIICLIIEFLKWPLFNNNLNKVFPILGFGIMCIFFVRIILYRRKNRVD